MKRRTFIAGLTGAAIWPATGGAQQAAIPVVGYLSTGDAGTLAETLAGVRRGLSETGYVEGRNLTIEYRWAQDHLERLPELAADLVRRQVAAIFVTNTPAALAAQAATKSIPIVFLVGADPVDVGLVVSLNRPGGNLTGFNLLINDLAAKRLEVLHEIVPRAKLVAYLGNPDNPAVAEAEVRELHAAARIFGLDLLIVQCKQSNELEPAFATLVRERADGLVVGGDGLFYRFRGDIIALAARHKVPAVHPDNISVAAGGLASYGTDYPDAWRQTGVYAGRILKGEKPADLPAQQMTNVQLAINLKTAKALGLTFPTSLLVRADEVIE
jgi:putative ABC transport system substrate-binding protein